MSTAALVAAAAANNAQWCHAVCQTHGAVGDFAAGAWACSRRTPPLYPDAVTLAPDVSPHDVLARVDRSAGCSIKDSFATLDLRPAGFQPLFDAEWIHRPGDLPAPVATGATEWVRVTTAEDLAAWESAWVGGRPGPRTFLPALLASSSVAILAGRSGERVVAGLVACVSERVVGLSNLFCADDDLVDAWAGGLAAVHRLFPRMPLVGYERGPDLDVARRLGCRAVGSLRVWWRPV